VRNLPIGFTNFEAQPLEDTASSLLKSLIVAHKSHIPGSTGGDARPDAALHHQVWIGRRSCDRTECMVFVFW